jgi:hypothetical protein
MYEGMTRQGHAATAAFSRDRAKAQLSQRVPTRSFAGDTIRYD